MEITQEQIEKYLQSLLDKKLIVKVALDKTPLTGLDPSKLTRKELATIGGTKQLDNQLTTSILAISDFIELISELEGSPIILNETILKEIDEMKSMYLCVVGIDNGEVKINSWAEQALNKM